MATYRKSTERMDFLIEEDCKKITITQKWRYIFLKESRASEWTDKEKSLLHLRINELIEDSWSKAFSLKVIGNSDFVERNKKTKWIIDFDISWVGYGEHWFVYITKTAEGSSGNNSTVYWFRGQIVINTNDLKEESYKGLHRTVFLHEFGHTLRNIAYYNTGDEYRSKSLFYDDKASIMNLSTEIRERHFGFLIEQLNEMIPKTKFIVR